MKLFNIIFALVALSVPGIEKGYAQQSYSLANTRYLDSVEQGIRNYICNDSLVYPAGYKKNLLKKEIPVIEVLNSFFDSTFEANQVNGKLKKIRFGKTRFAKVNKTETDIGLIKVIHVIINGPYLHADVKLDCIGNIVIRKSILLNSNSIGRCGLHGNQITDFKMFKTFVIPKLKFPISVRDYADIIATGFLQKNLAKAAEINKDYRFNLPSDKAKKDDWINNILYNQYNSDSACCYSYYQPPEDFVALIRNGQLALINDLLYSPNYLYAVNAMEAMIYLANENKLVINDSIRTKMELLKQERSVLTVQRTSDVLGIMQGYNELKTTNQQVIQKYRNGIPL
ncbi:hypothetical protein [Niastella populi]|uniref:Uncharacterized protein n=1 Tax=Niastella populi TaxID=550983 RepID=A0A1V9FQX1_9BACT|nr:hypothetical protein [Niastella populi]OQP60789.1 hypothetical protein A4R26_19480 [Niastella populi]